jgi:hypothetical protein
MTASTRAFDLDPLDVAAAQAAAETPPQSRAAAARSQLRSRYLSTVSRFYKPLVHLAGTTGVGLATLALSITKLQNVRPAELLVIPAVVVTANFFEWFAHKEVLHVRRPFPWSELYDQHTPKHHKLYHEEDMAIRDRREWRLVLIPAAGVLGIVTSTAPLAYALGKLISPNAGWLTLLTTAVYMVSYELLHLSYHLPENHPVGGSALIRALRKHHAKHHDPRLMQRWNFNVTLPLADWILGTIAGPETRRSETTTDAEPSAPEPSTEG